MFSGTLRPCPRTKERCVFPDIRFEADFLRAALLAGLIRELDVQAWAEAFLAAAPDERGLLADVVVSRTELTALREALQPLAEPANHAATGEAVVSFLALDPAAAAMSVPNRLRVLGL